MKIDANADKLDYLIEVFIPRLEAQISAEYDHLDEELRLKEYPAKKELVAENVICEVNKDSSVVHTTDLVKEEEVVVGPMDPDLTTQEKLVEEKIICDVTENLLKKRLFVHSRKIWILFRCRKNLRMKILVKLQKAK